MSDPAPGFTLSILDGQVGAAAPVGGDTPVILGCSSAGVEGALGAQFFAANQLTELTAAFGTGPGPQLVSRLLNKGRACGFLKLHATTAGSGATTVTPGTGNTSAAVMTLTGAARDYFRGLVKVEKSGTVGVAGILLSVSYDNGDIDFSDPFALPTGGSIALPNSGLTAVFTTATLVAGDTFSFTSTPPKWNATDLAAGLAAVTGVSFAWDWGYLAGACSATEAAAVGAQLDAWQAAGRYTGFMIETAQQLAANDATYQAALIADYVTFTHKRIMAVAGDVRVFSPLDLSTYLRPLGWQACERSALRDPTLFELGRVKTDADNTGGLDCSLFGPIKSINAPAPPIGHNEGVNPGLDNPTTMAALGFATATTYPTKNANVFITRGRMLSPKGSDFATWRLRRIMDVACTATQGVLTEEIQETPPLNQDGTIDNSYATALESTCTQAILNSLGAAISGCRVVVDRTNNIPITKKINVKISILPRGDIEQISETIGYVASLVDNTTTTEAA